MSAGPQTNIGNAQMPDDHWVAAMGLELFPDPEGFVHGRASMLPSMWAPRSKRPRLGILATLVDVVGGHVPHGPHTPTIDLRIQLVDTAPSDGPIELRARPLKIGRRLISSETTLADHSGRPFAVATTTFMNQEVEGAGLDGAIRPVTPIESFEALVDARPVGAAALEIDPTEKVSNGLFGTIQGGAQAFLAELAAERLFTDTTAHAVDLDIRYLNRLRVGPLRATATDTGRTGSLRNIRVALTDVGHAAAGGENALVSQVTLLMAED